MFSTFGHTQVVLFAHTTIEESLFPLVESSRIRIFDSSGRVKFTGREYHLIISYVIDIIACPHIIDKRLAGIAACQGISLSLSVQILVVKCRPKGFVIFPRIADNIILRNSPIIKAHFAIYRDRQPTFRATFSSDKHHSISATCPIECR